MIFVQQLLDNWIQIPEKNSGALPLEGPPRRHCHSWPFGPLLTSPSAPAGASAAQHVCSLHRALPAQGQAHRGSSLQRGAFFCTPTTPGSVSDCKLHFFIHLSHSTVITGGVGTSPMKCSISGPAASRPARGGLRKSLEWKTALPRGSRYQEKLKRFWGLLGRKIFCLFVGMKELGTHNLPGKAAPAPPPPSA